MVVSLGMTACSMVYATPQYDYENVYQEDYAFLDDYATVNWNNAEYGYLQYSYYDFDRVFIVIYGNRIYIIPYEYFYRYIMPHFRGRIVWRSYDYLANWWGYSYYNGLWSHWYHRHYRSYWRPQYDYYWHHKNRNTNKPFIIHKNQLQQPNAVRRQVNPQPRLDTRYRSKLNTPDRMKNYNYIPRNERHFVPRSDYPRSFRTPSNTPSNTASLTTSNRASSPQPIKQDDKDKK